MEVLYKDPVLNEIESETDEDSPVKIFDKYKDFRITDESEIEEPEPIVSINNQAVCTPGNLTVISGQGKSSKTAFCNTIMAGAIRLNDDQYDGFPGLEIKQNIHNEANLHIDTEQAPHHHFKNFKNSILKRSGRDTMPEYFYSYNIRQLALKEYKDITNELFYACHKQHGGIHLAVIDGIADYIASVNDEAEANEIVHYFSSLAILYNTPIITVIHLNPGSNKERGHLGSQLLRKAESIITIRKDKNTGISYIDAKDFRSASGRDIPAIQYKYDLLKGYHVYAGIRYSDSVSGIAKYEQLASQFSGTSIQHKEAIKRIIEFTGKSLRTANNYLKEMVELDLIIKSENGYEKCKI